MKGATQETIEKHSQMVSSEFSSDTRILTPTGMGLKTLPTEHLPQKGKSGIDDLAMRGQPQTSLARPVGAVGVIVGWHRQDSGPISIAPVTLPAGGVKATVSQIGTLVSSPHRLESPQMSDGQRQAARASLVRVARRPTQARLTLSGTQEGRQTPALIDIGIGDQPAGNHAARGHARQDLVAGVEAAMRAAVSGPTFPQPVAGLAASLPIAEGWQGYAIHALIQVAGLTELLADDLLDDDERSPQPAYSCIELAASQHVWKHAPSML